jgi:hypothetical protein
MSSDYDYLRNCDGRYQHAMRLGAHNGSAFEVSPPKQRYRRTVMMGLLFTVCVAVTSIGLFAFAAAAGSRIPIQ